MVGLVLGPADKEWLEEYKRYTGLTMPIMDGAETAKALRIAFVPSIVVVSPSNNTSYLKTGQQSFERLYEFVRRVQGVSTEMPEGVKQLMQVSIGEKEEKRKTGRPLLWDKDAKYVRAKAPKYAWGAKKEKTNKVGTF